MNLWNHLNLFLCSCCFKHNKKAQPWDETSVSDCWDIRQILVFQNPLMSASWCFPLLIWERWGQNLARQFLKQQNLPYYWISLDINKVFLPCDGQNSYFRGFSPLRRINSLEKHTILIIPKILGIIASDCQTALIMWRWAIWAKSCDTGSISATGGG